MASKKYKPALFELVSKGQLKPNDKGGMPVPNWFYRQRTEQGTATKTPAGPQKTVKTETVAAPTAPAAPKATPSPRIDQEPDSAVSFSEARLQVDVSYWLVGVIVLALILLLLLSFSLGQRSGRRAVMAAETEQLANAAPSDALADIASSPVQPRLLPDRSARETTPPVTLAPAEPAPTTPPRTAAQPRSGNALIIASHVDRDQLVPVRQYFAAKGIETLIGRFGRRYVLYSSRTFQRSRGPDAVQFKNSIATLGGGYNREKPKEALPWPAATFASAYYAGVTQIEPTP